MDPTDLGPGTATWLGGRVFHIRGQTLTRLFVHAY